MLISKLRPVTHTEKEIFEKNPTLFIEGKLGQLKDKHSIINLVFDLSTKLDLSNTDFYRYLAYYALMALEEVKEKCQK